MSLSKNFIDLQLIIDSNGVLCCLRRPVRLDSSPSPLLSSPCSVFSALIVSMNLKLVVYKIFLHLLHILHLLHLLHILYLLHLLHMLHMLHLLHMMHKIDRAKSEAICRERLCNVMCHAVLSSLSRLFWTRSRGLLTDTWWWLRNALKQQFY